MNVFLNETRKYLINVIDNELILPHHDKIDIDNSIHLTCSAAVNEISCKEDQKPSNILKYLTVFMLYDAYLENKYSYLQNEDYGNRFDKLPSITINEIIEKEFYCILLVLRNAIIHHMNKIVENIDSISVIYNSNKHNNEIDISLESLNLVISYVVYRINENILNDEYLKRYSIEYYQLARKKIKKLIYKGNNIKLLKIAYCPFPIYRNYIIIKDEGSIAKYVSKLDNLNLKNNTDFVIIKKDEQFIIPVIEYQGFEKMFLVNAPSFT